MTEKERVLEICRKGDVILRNDIMFNKLKNDCESVLQMLKTEGIPPQFTKEQVTEVFKIMFSYVRFRIGNAEA